VKFKVDENLPEELCQLFAAAGWNCQTIVQQELGGTLDPRVAEVCRSAKTNVMCSASLLGLSTR